MAVTLDDLLACLRLEQVAPDAFEGPNLDIGYHRVFGGQVLAQCVVVAAGAAPGKVVRSLHVAFPREGDAGVPLRYEVTSHHVGRTFATVGVTARQGERVVAVATASLHAEESEGPAHGDGPPDVGPPSAAVATDLGLVPWETRIVDGVDLADPTVGPPELAWWSRTPPLDAGVADEVHRALLAHATDLTLIGTALRPVEGLSQADSTGRLATAVTTHSLSFHRPFRVDDWLLVVQRAPVLAGGRAYGRGDVFAGDALVASFTQESMIRVTDGARHRM